MVGAIGSIGAVGGFGGAGLSAVSGVANTLNLGTGPATAATGATGTPTPSAAVSISAAGRTALDTDNLRSSVATLATNSGAQGVNSGAQGVVAGAAAHSDNGTAVSNSTVNSTITIDVVNAPTETINLSNQNISGLLQAAGTTNGNTLTNTATTVGSLSFSDLLSLLNTPVVTTLSGVPSNDQLVAMLLLALLMKQTEQTAIVI